MVSAGGGRLCIAPVVQLQLARLQCMRNGRAGFLHSHEHRIGVDVSVTSRMSIADRISSALDASTILLNSFTVGRNSKRFANVDKSTLWLVYHCRRRWRL